MKRMDSFSLLFTHTTQSRPFFVCTYLFPFLSIVFISSKEKCERERKKTALTPNATPSELMKNGRKEPTPSVPSITWLMSLLACARKPDVWVFKWHNCYYAWDKLDGPIFFCVGTSSTLQVSCTKWNAKCRNCMQTEFCSVMNGTLEAFFFALCKNLQLIISGLKRWAAVICVCVCVCQFCFFFRLSNALSVKMVRININKLRITVVAINSAWFENVMVQLADKEMLLELLLLLAFCPL